MDFVHVCSVIPSGFGDLLLCDLAEGIHFFALKTSSSVKWSCQVFVVFLKLLLLEMDVFLVWFVLVCLFFSQHVLLSSMLMFVSSKHSDVFFATHDKTNSLSKIDKTYGIPTKQL